MLLLELHALTQATCSYVLLLSSIAVTPLYIYTYTPAAYSDLLHILSLNTQLMSSSDQENKSNQSEEVMDVEVVDQGPPCPQANHDAEPDTEEERTLTDHLNKKLLQAFLQRIESGTMQLPEGAQGTAEEGDEFNDD